MNLHQVLVHIHSGLRWLVLIFIIVVILMAVVNLKNKFSKNHPLGIFIKPSLIFMHIQLLIGLVLYFISPKVVFAGSSMKDGVLRFFLVEHILLMVIAVILVTAGYVKSKKSADFKKKNRTLVIYYSFALLLILLAIPWPFRELGAGWF